MLNGTNVRLTVYSPERDHPITKPATAKVSGSRIEFNNSKFYELDGSLYNVVPAQFDITGSRFSYKVISGYSGTFLNVPDKGGFNGYGLKFDALGGGQSKSLYAADIVVSDTSLGITRKNVTITKNSLYVNADGLAFDHGDTVEIELGFAIGGTSAANRLIGGNGRDKINGGSGNDIISGSGGSDRLYGGAGKDAFVFKSIKDSAVASGGRDTIFDFSRADKDLIDLRGIDADLTTAGNGAFSFIGTSEFGSKAGELRYDKRASDTYIYGDVDGDGAADFSIHLDDAVSLSKAYFVL
jgi:Ca2+-binding RTX toxin-like protein